MRGMVIPGVGNVEDSYKPGANVGKRQTHGCSTDPDLRGSTQNFCIGRTWSKLPNSLQLELVCLSLTISVSACKDHLFENAYDELLYINIQLRSEKTIKSTVYLFTHRTT